MSDLSNLLGAVYGSNDPDGPSTRHEPSAAERAQMAAPAPRIDDDLAAALSAALVTPTPDANVGAPAPVPTAPVAAAPAPQQAAYVQPTYNTGSVAWAKGDDDIYPVAVGKKR